MQTSDGGDWDPYIHPIKEVDTARCIEKLKKFGEVCSYAQGEPLAKPGEASGVCFIVLEGEVVAQVLTEAGAVNQYIAHKPGYTLLEAQCFCEWTEAAAFLAKEPTEALMLKRADLFKAIEGDSELALFFIGTLSQKFRWYVEHARNLSAHSALKRCCDLLLTLAEHDSGAVTGERRFCKRISQEEIGNRLHVNRLTVIRCMKDLRDRGFIEMNEKKICFPDIDALKRFRDTV